MSNESLPEMGVGGGGGRMSPCMPAQMCSIRLCVEGLVCGRVHGNL